MSRTHSNRFRWFVALLAIAVVASFWVRSYWRADAFVFFTPAGKVQVLASSDGQLTLFFSSITAGWDRGLSLRWMIDRPANAADIAMEFYDLASFTRARFDFAFITGPTNGTATIGGGAPYCAVQCPHWFIFAALVLPTAFAARRALRRRRWRRQGLCVACGYDLRESPQRCPECGIATGA